MRRVDLAAARDQLSQLVQAVLGGEEITLCRHGEPVVDLVPTTRQKRETPVFATMKGRLEIIDRDWAKGIETKEELEAWLEGKF